MLRIGTWNVEHASPAKNPHRLERLRAADADIWVLTETQDALDLGSSYHAVHSEPRPKKPSPARWVSIWSKHPIIQRVPVREPIRTVAALCHTPLGNLLVYGTVMPWSEDRGPAGTASWGAERLRVVPEQAAEWKAMWDRFPDAAICVAGDFNIHIGGGLCGTRKGQRLLHDGLSAAGLACVTGTDRIREGKLPKPHVDHICLPEAWAQRSRVVEAWPGTVDGVRLSDHSAVVVQVQG